MAPKLEALRGIIDLPGAPQGRALGLRLVSLEAGEATLACPYSPKLVGDIETGVIAGGVVTTLLDQTCGYAVMAALERPVPVVTVDLRIDYLRPAEPGLEILAHARCYKLTRSVAFVRAVAYDRDPDHPVATVQSTFMLNAQPPGPPKPSAKGGERG